MATTTEVPGADVIAPDDEDVGYLAIGSAYPEAAVVPTSATPAARPGRRKNSLT